jgi:type IX secretion system substrate protein
MLKSLCTFVAGLLFCLPLFSQGAEDSKFSGFVTRSDNESVSLFWEIPDSSDIQHFIVEKSKNGLQWKSLDTILHMSSTYSYRDNEPSIGLNYYRILAENSGKTFYSIIRRAYVGKIENNITVYPNPVTRNLRFQMTALTKGRYHAVVYNSAGNMIAGEVIEHDGNNNTVNLALPQTTAKGIYRLVLLTKNEFYKQIFLVQ